MNENKIPINNGKEESPTLTGGYAEFQKKDAMLDTVAWYMVVFGFILLALAGVCLYSRVIHYRDFSINGTVLGNYLLILGICLYAAGRAIKYYRKFKKSNGD